ncbi:MAG: quinolinate synthase NadA [Deltaproteobacteria bacterium]|nr:quinolinate synthase NadA [Deltaproteobacteria bacterium]
MKEKIRRLLKERRAILLAHNYQPPEIQEVADLCGDSLELSIKASETDAAVIVFCGVHFMAETASILSPEKTVLLPRPDAGCPMADMITPEALLSKLAELGPMPVVTYVNSPASVKAISTVCCTSANVLAVVSSLDAPEILMTPDRNLARYAASQTPKTIHAWEGYCPIHDRLTPEDVKAARNAHPDAVFMAHPECRKAVLDMADAVLSTSGMIRFAKTSPHLSFIVGTEMGLMHALQKTCPDKAFYPASASMICPDMKKIRLEDVIRSLETLEGQVKVPESVRVPALEAVRRMIGIAG